MDEFLIRLRELLDELDDCRGDDMLDELNATLEDVILMLEDADEDDIGEIKQDALEELGDLYVQYSRIPGMFPYSERLKDIVSGLK